MLDWIEEARDSGGTILTGGRLDGDLLRPTVVEQPPQDAKLSCDEVFGPVCTLEPYDELDEAIDAGERDAVRPAGRDLHDEPSHGALRRRACSSSAA